jgi:hypothetical protein
VPCSPHVFRHTAAVWMAEADVPMEQIAQYLGHTSTRVTFRDLRPVFAPVHGDRGEGFGLVAGTSVPAEPSDSSTWKKWRKTAVGGDGLEPPTLSV